MKFKLTKVHSFFQSRVLFMMMKTFILLMCTTVFGFTSEKSFSQEKITIDIDKVVSVDEVFDIIQDQTKYRFLYPQDLFANAPKVHLKKGVVGVAELLRQSFSDSVEFTLSQNNRIVIRERNSYDKPADVFVQQQFEISGLVLDEQGEPLPGASILEKGTTNGVQSDFDGNFSLNVANEDATLVVSYLGFATKEVAVNGQTTINIQLKENAAGLDEVVVVGYGSLKKRDITGAVGSLKMDETLQSRSVVDFGQAMAGKMAGVQVLNGSGRPGSSSAIQIRGINSISAGNSPLIVIDGVQLPEYNLNSINSSDIESIEVLKDASSASIYGSRGANGVILVTTKSGKLGNPELQVNYTSSIQEVIRQMDVMNASEYAQTAIDAAQNGWIGTGGDPNAPNTIGARGNYKYTWPLALESPETLANTNFQDVIFRAAPMNKIDLRYSGGNEKSDFSVSGGYINQKGIIITSEYEKYSLNIKVQSKIKNWLSVGTMLNSVYEHENQPLARIVEWAIQYPSIYPVYGNNGYLGGPLSVDGFENYSGILFRPNNGHPLYVINNENENRRFTAMGNFYLKLKFSDEFNFKSSINTFYKQANNTGYNVADHNLGDAFKTTAGFSSGMDRLISYNWSNLLTYDKSFKGHSFNAIAGFEYNHREFYTQTARREGYDNDNIQSLSAGQDVVGANDDANATNLVSVLSRVNYNYLDKYIIGVSYRRDGSSRFGPSTKWGDFYSLSGAWRVSDEKFLKSWKSINNLKLKASYGVTGNDGFADYVWISKLAKSRTAIGNNLITTYFPSNIENPDLEWEGTKQLNFGLDIGFWQNRLSIETDFYTSKSNNLLLNVPIPSTSGFTSAFSNNGEVGNKGFELNIQSRNISHEKLSWTTQLNYSMNRSEVTRLGRNNAPQIFNVTSGPMQKINEVGKPLFGFYGYQYDGVYINQAEIDADPSSPAYITPGDGRYKDINNDGVLNSDDRTIIGNVQPDFTWGVTNNFTFGNLVDLSFSFQGVVGGEIYNNNSQRSLFYHEGRNYLKEVNGRWRSEQDPGDGYHYKVSVDTKGLEKTASSYWLEDQTYLRLKDLTIGFRVPEKITSQLGALNARLFFNGVNLFTISNANVYDPENFVTAVTNSVNRGVSGAVYPSARIYSLGLNVKF